MPCPAAHSELVQATLIVGGAALAVVLALLAARIDERRETARRRRLMAEALDRYEQSQHFWRASADTERRA